MERREFVWGAGATLVAGMSFATPAQAALLPWNLLNSTATLITLWGGPSLLWSAYDKSYGGSKEDKIVKEALGDQGFVAKQPFSIPHNGKNQPVLLGQKPNKPIANCAVVMTDNGPVMFEGGAIMTMHDAWRSLEKSGHSKQDIAKLTKPDWAMQNTNSGDICTGYGRPFKYGTQQGSVDVDWKARPYAGKIWTGGKYRLINSHAGTAIEGDSNAYVINNC
jgi:hypothetical protein